MDKIEYYGGVLPVITFHKTKTPEYLVVWRNPGSTNDRRAGHVIAGLQRSGIFKDVLVITSQQNKRRQDSARLQQLLTQHRDNVWLVVSGGDGTVSAVVNILMRDAVGPLPPIFPLHAGNSNDIATMLHGHKRITLARLLQAKQQAVRILECTFTDAAGREVTRYAVAYISFGITAHTARSINDPAHRSTKNKRHSNTLRRRVHEIRRLKNVLSIPRPFTITANGEEKQLFERIIINGRRMATCFRWPVALADATFHDVSIERFGTIDNMKNLARMAAGRLRGVHKTKDDSVECTFITPTIGQLDGETLEIAAGTRLRVRLTDVSVPFVSL